MKIILRSILFVLILALVVLVCAPLQAVYGLLSYPISFIVGASFGWSFCSIWEKYS